MRRHESIRGDEMGRISLEQLGTAEALLFGRGLNHLHFKLLEARPLASGGVILRYEPAGQQ